MNCEEQCIARILYIRTFVNLNNWDSCNTTKIWTLFIIIFRCFLFMFFSFSLNSIRSSFKQHDIPLIMRMWMLVCCTFYVSVNTIAIALPFVNLNFYIILFINIRILCICKLDLVFDAILDCWSTRISAFLLLLSFWFCIAA